MKAASVSGLVDFERHFCVNGFVVRNDPVVPVPEDEGGDDGSGADEAGEPKLLADADVDDAIAGHDVDLPRNHGHVKLKRFCVRTFEKEKSMVTIFELHSFLRIYITIYTISLGPTYAEQSVIIQYR